MKGRRLPEVSNFIEYVQQVAHERIDALSRASYDGDQDLTLQLVHSYRYVAAFAKERFAFVNRVPYLLCNATIPSIAKKCPCLMDACIAVCLYTAPLEG